MNAGKVKKIVARLIGKHFPGRGKTVATPAGENPAGATQGSAKDRASETVACTIEIEGTRRAFYELRHCMDYNGIKFRMIRRKK